MTMVPKIIIIGSIILHSSIYATSEYQPMSLSRGGGGGLITGERIASLRRNAKKTDQKNDHSLKPREQPSHSRRRNTRAKSNDEQYQLPSYSTDMSNSRYYSRMHSDDSNNWIGVPPVNIETTNNDNDEGDTDTTSRHSIENTTNDSITSSSLLELPCSLLLRTSSSNDNNNSKEAIPISTYLDTGAQVTVMTLSAAKRAGLAHLIDVRYAGHATGVAGVSCKVLGRIPARTVSLVFGNTEIVDRSPAICVLKDGIGSSNSNGSSGVDLLLGLDALEDWRAGICLRDRTLTVRRGRLGSRVNYRTTSMQEEDEDDNMVIPFVGNMNHKKNRGTTKSCGDGSSCGNGGQHYYHHEKVRERMNKTTTNNNSATMSTAMIWGNNNKSYKVTGKEKEEDNYDGGWKKEKNTERIPYVIEQQYDNERYQKTHQPTIIATTSSLPSGPLSSDLENDLELLESTTSGIPAYYSSEEEEGEGYEDEGYQEEDNSYNSKRLDREYWDEDDGYYEEEYCDASYDVCDLSGI